MSDFWWNERKSSVGPQLSVVCCPSPHFQRPRSIPGCSGATRHHGLGVRVDVLRSMRGVIPCAPVPEQAAKDEGTPRGEGVQLSV
jgi:hypothetical protein